MIAFKKILLLAFMALALPSFASNQAKPSPCADVPHSDHPKVLLSNGTLEALIFLPDPEKGYYRSTRFDWSGVVACVSYNGHRFFGEWFKDYDPLTNDAITGPVEEFRSEDGAIGYSEAKPGELFVKPGVGVLRKVDDSPYKFGFPYPLIDPGKWTVATQAHSITFTHTLNGPNGIAYIYEKTLSIDGFTMTLSHSLHNTGQKAIDTSVYDHDFYIFDGHPTAPGISIRFPFKPELQDSFAPAATLEGNSITYQQELQPKQTVASYIKGYSDKASDYDFTIEDKNTGVGVEQSSDNPISRFYLWSIRTTVSPEAYIHLNVPPGQTSKWKIHYRFFGPPAHS
ncbi:MAG TPA: hypothetical protein VIX42_08510 [Edaphobacter sp.]